MDEDHRAEDDGDDEIEAQRAKRLAPNQLRGATHLLGQLVKPEPISFFQAVRQYANISN